jgi:hypothetical protein
MKKLTLFILFFVFCVFSSKLFTQDNGSATNNEYVENPSTLTKIKTIMLSSITEEKIEELLKEDGLFDRALEEYCDLKELLVLQGAIENIFMMGHELDYEHRSKVAKLYAEVMIKREDLNKSIKAAKNPLSKLKKYLGTGDNLRSDDFTLNEVANKLYQDLKKNDWMIDFELFTIIKALLDVYVSEANKSSANLNTNFYKLSSANLEMIRLLNELVVFVSYTPGLGKVYANINLNSSGFVEMKNNIKQTRLRSRNFRIK